MAIDYASLLRQAAEHRKNDPDDDCNMHYDLLRAAAVEIERLAMNRMAAEAIKPPTDWGRYRHYKGGVYTVLPVRPRLEATLGDLVVYQGANGQVWARPAEEFYGEVSPGVRRFVQIKDEPPQNYVTVVMGDGVTAEVKAAPGIRPRRR